MLAGRDSALRKIMNPPRVRTAGIPALPTGILLLFVCLIYVYLKAAWVLGISNPDGASYVLMGQDLLRMNWNLHGWKLGLGTNWPLGVMAYAGALLVKGFGQPTQFARSIPLAAALVFALTVASAVWATMRSYRGGVALLAGLVTLLFVGLPPAETVKAPGEYIFGVAFEESTVMGAVLSLVLFWSALCPRPDESRPSAWRTIVVLFVALVIAAFTIAGEALALVTITIPVLSLFAITLWRGRGERIYAAGAAFAILSAIAAHWVLALVRVTGGFTWMAFTPMFAGFDDLINRNLPLTVKGLIAFYGADWFGRPVSSWRTWSVLVHFIALLFVLWAVY